LSCRTLEVPRAVGMWSEKLYGRLRLLPVRTALQRL
jgi:hypothetical protein